MNLFFDTNILLDIMLHREPHYAASAMVFAAIEQKFVAGCISAVSVSTLAYLLQKELGRELAHVHITDILRVLTICDVNASTIHQALASPARDIEDAIQYYSALEANVTHIITRNQSDFSFSTLPVLSPNEYILRHRALFKAF